MSLLYTIFMLTLFVSGITIAQSKKNDQQNVIKHNIQKIKQFEIVSTHKKQSQVSFAILSTQKMHRELSDQQQQQYAHRRSQERQLRKKRYSISQEITRTQKVRQFQLKQKQEIVNSTSITKKYAFQVEQAEQFVMKIPLQQNLILAIDNYVSTGKHYRTISDITTQSPSRIFIYENDISIFEKSFFFHLGLSITLKSNIKYSFKFYNGEKDTRLIFLQMNCISQKAFNQAISNNDHQQHLSKLYPLTTELNSVLDSLSNQGLLNQLLFNQFISINSYYYYAQLLEIAFTIIISLFQLYIIQKLLVNQKQLT